MAYARRKDSNHNELAEQLHWAGFHVEDTSRFGHGFPDMIVTGYNRNTDTMAALLVEVKTSRGKLTVDEELWRREYPDDGPYLVARSADDVLKWFGAV